MGSISPGQTDQSYCVQLSFTVLPLLCCNLDLKRPCPPPSRGEIPIAVKFKWTLNEADPLRGEGVSGQ